MTALANAALRIAMLCFLSGILLMGCAREKPNAGYWGDLARGVKDVRP